MSLKKTIQINPEFFKLPGSKTKKNKEKKELQLTPIINPNTLKNKLLKRIKEHKKQEIKMNQQIATKNTDGYTDEFYGAMDYLSDLSKKQKMDKAKQRTLNAKTLKNYNNHNPPVVSLEMPYELEHFNAQVTNDDVFNVNYKVNDDVPYGCLKGGKKKTYREWKEINSPVDIPDIVRPPTPPKEHNILTNNSNNSNNQNRQERLEKIKLKLRQLEDEEKTMKQKTIDDFKMIEDKLSKPIIDDDLNDDIYLDDEIVPTKDVTQIIKEKNDKLEEEKQKNKKYVKKTIKKKFTLGKSDKLRHVSVLIKNQQTRKNIINTQKEIKKMDITNVKKYLKQHGLIKAGSTCPPDILRKTFESALLTGEITNTNRETLLHNFMHDDKL
jgi:hypothetical protein